jgi:ketosteroid isomerase-like protein
MTLRPARAPVLAVLALAVACSTPAADSAATPAVEESPDHAAIITSLAGAYVAAYNSKNAAALGELHAQDAAIFPADAPAVHGRLEIEQALSRNFARYQSAELKLEPHSTWGGGGFAYQEGSATMHATLADGTAVDQPVTFVMVARRQADGGWKLHRVIWNRTTRPAP